MHVLEFRTYVFSVTTLLRPLVVRPAFFRLWERIQYEYNTKEIDQLIKLRDETCLTNLRN